LEACALGEQTAAEVPGGPGLLQLQRNLRRQSTHLHLQVLTVFLLSLTKNKKMCSRDGLSLNWKKCLHLSGVPGPDSVDLQITGILNPDPYF
jgi:hypothetical protein